MSDFGEFSVENDCWKNYIERFIYSMKAREITSDDMMKANLFAVCGSELYDLILSLITPYNVNNVRFSFIEELLNKHFHPPPNKVVESFKFHTRNQYAKERMRDYIVQLKKLSINCDFEDLDRTLRDRLVCGILYKELQKELLQKNDLTFEVACQLAISHEMAKFDSSLIASEQSQPNSDDEEVQLDKKSLTNYREPLWTNKK